MSWPKVWVHVAGRERLELRQSRLSSVNVALCGKGDVQGIYLNVLNVLYSDLQIQVGDSIGRGKAHQGGEAG